MSHPPPTTTGARIARAVNALAVDLIRHTPSVEGNSVFSPLALLVSLATFGRGTGGTLAAALERSLDLDVGAVGFRRALISLLGPIDRGPGGSDESATIATSIWFDVDLDLRAEPLRSMEEGPTQIERIAPAAPEADERIDEWASEASGGRIVRLLGGPLPSRGAIVASLLAFRGEWACPFDPAATETRPFTLESGEEIEVPTMRRTERFAFGQRADYQVASLPFWNASLVLVVPRRGIALDEVRGNLPPSIVADSFDRLDPRTLDLSLPRFSLDRPPALEALLARRVSDLLSGDPVEFPGIAPGTVQVRLRHGSSLDVTERGASVPSSTSPPLDELENLDEGRFGGVNRPIAFTVDRPFLFFLVHRTRPLVLLAGQVVHPTPTPSPTASASDSAPA